jgi:hypothetical protein
MLVGLAGVGTDENFENHPARRGRWHANGVRQIAHQEKAALFLVQA